MTESEFKFCDGKEYNTKTQICLKTQSPSLINLAVVKNGDFYSIPSQIHKKPETKDEEIYLKEKYMSFSIRPIKLSRELLQLLISKQKISINENNELVISDISDTTFVLDNEFTQKSGGRDYYHYLDTYETGTQLKDDPYISATIEILNLFIDQNINKLNTLTTPTYNFHKDFLSWRKVNGKDKVCEKGDWDLTHCCMQIFKINDVKYFLFGHPYAKMIEHFEQELEGKKLIDHYLDMREEYKPKDEGEHYGEFNQLLNIISPVNKEYIYERKKSNAYHTYIQGIDSEITSLNDNKKELFKLALGKLATEITYNFKIFKLEDNKLKSLGHNIRYLKKSHVKVLEIARNLIKEFMKMFNTSKSDSNSDNDIFHNIFCYFKYPASGLTIHVEYIPPFQNIELYGHKYDNIIKLNDIINLLLNSKYDDIMEQLNLSVTLSPGSMPFRDDYENSLYQLPENNAINEVHGIQTGGAEMHFDIFTQNTKVIYVYTEQNYTSHCFLKMKMKFFT